MRARAVVWGHIRPLLIYSVLTASTIGPGTVAMCSKAGSEFGAALLWCVLVAAVVAWVMQEGSARLTILSGLTLGQSLRFLTPSGWRQKLRHAILAFVIFGSFACVTSASNTRPHDEPGMRAHRRHHPLADTCNNFAGTMAAVDMIVPDAAARTIVNLGLVSRAKARTAG